MDSRFWLLAAVLAALPAHAEDVPFAGHVLDVDASQEQRTILRMTGTRYGINGSTAQILDKARQCIGSQSGLTLDPVDPDSSTLSAQGRRDYRQFWSTHSVRTRLTLEASDGHFRIVQSALGQAQGNSAETPDDAYLPISQQGGDWQNAITAAIAMATGLADCMYR